TIIAGSYQLNANQDADGDGFSNGFEQTNGINPLAVNPSFVVTNSFDNGGRSLRNAIAAANPSANGVITFSQNVTGTIVLTKGELVITNTMAIIGPGANVLAVSGNNSNRVFEIVSGGGNGIII